MKNIPLFAQKDTFHPKQLDFLAASSAVCRIILFAPRTPVFGLAVCGIGLFTHGHIGLFAYLRL